MTHKIIEQLRRERRQLAVSQDDLASRIGTYQNYLSYIENGKHRPSFDFIQNWADALGYELALVKKP